MIIVINTFLILINSPKNLHQIQRACTKTSIKTHQTPFCSCYSFTLSRVCPTQTLLLKPKKKNTRTTQNKSKYQKQKPTAQHILHLTHKKKQWTKSPNLKTIHFFFYHNIFQININQIFHLKYFQYKLPSNFLLNIISISNIIKYSIKYYFNLKYH